MKILLYFFKLNLYEMFMLWRSYNEVMKPENDEIIKKAIRFTQKLILDYYRKKGEKYSQEIMVFIDDERKKTTDKLNYAFIFYNDKKNIGKNITPEDFHFIDDRILGAVKVYGKHLEKDRQYLMLEELDIEINNIKKLLERHSVEGGYYDLYTTLYIELVSAPSINKS